MNESFYRETRCTFAMVLHPMYVIIEEDAECAERTPPWGSPSIEDYVERLKRNLDVVENHPPVKLCFEFSGMELEALAERDPSCIRRMRRLAREGEVCFVNGTYAQPHLQILGSESVFRQFEEGLAAIERLVGYRVHTYAVDEPGIVEQLPQILGCFGYRFAHVPSGDTYAIRFLDEHELIGLANPRKLDYVIGEEFTSWQGLDGTLIPLHLTLPVNIEADFREIEIFDPGREDLYAARRFFPGAPAVLWNDSNRDLYRSGEIKMAIGDMGAVTEEWLETRLLNVDFVLLDRALEQRIRVCPPKSRARMYEYWSSAEGIGAEEQLRYTRKAEQGMVRLSALDALARILLHESGENLTPLWKRILWTQHHDAYWAGGTELRRKCIQRLRAIDEELRGKCLSRAAFIAENTARTGDGDYRLTLFNTCPYARKDVAVIDCAFEKGEAGGISFSGLDSQVLDAAYFEDGSLKQCRVMALWASDGLGYASCPVINNPAGSTAAPAWETVRQFAYENDGYRVLIGEDGLFKSLYSKQARAELLDARSLKGNEVRYRMPSGEWRSSGEGPVVMRRASGAVADVLHIESRIGDIPIETGICFYHAIHRIDIQAEIGFSKNELGIFWDDASKLNVYWPLYFSGRIRHDVPFGSVEGREHRPLLATRWVDVSENRMGLAFFNRGTVKHWIRDRTLANVWAWGTLGNCFNNRNLPAFFMKGFDLRVDGRQRIEYALYPHGGFSDAAVVSVSRSYADPPLGLVVKNAAGALPSACLALAIENGNIETTVVEATGNGMRCRIYESSGLRGARPEVRATVPWSDVTFRDLHGERREEINPFQIGWLYAER